MTSATNSQTNNIVFGRDNPTLASSQASGHPARLANDGDASTFWQAAKADTNAWWQVDLERLLVVKKVRLTFPSNGNHHYKIEVSPDQIQWKVFMDESRANIPGRIEVHSGIETTGRYLRVTLTRATKKQPASLAEVEVWGHVQSQ